MKKVLSVLLAAAMVMGMSVSAFAADYTYGANSTNDLKDGTTKLSFDDVAKLEGLMLKVSNGAATVITPGSEITLNPGDDLYIGILDTNGNYYDGAIDKDWSINIKGSNIDGASFYTVPSTVPAWAVALGTIDAKDKFVKVEIADELDSTSITGTAKFKFYVADNEFVGVKSEEVEMYATFKNLGSSTVDFEWVNDAEDARIWTVAKNAKGTAIFDFNDDVFFTVKMISEEKVVLNLSTAYDKAIDKEYNEYDAELSFYNFKGSKDAFTKKGELFIPAEEDTFIYEIVDEALVEVDATWTDEYTIDGVAKEYEGWVIETKELGYYVVADEELVVAEEEVEAKPEVEADKANPETGAADFVGAAVAMAVVSVAAAGALALKK